jgi:hypothetical protein
MGQPVATPSTLSAQRSRKGDACMTERKKLGTLLFLLVLVNGCSSLCGKSGSVSTPGGSGPGSTIARVLAACDSAGTGIALTVSGVFADGGGATHEITTTAKLTNPNGTSITWTNGTDGTPGPMSGTSGSGTAVSVQDSTDVWQVDVSIPVQGKTMTITGKIRKNSSPPPPCSGEGTWNIPGVGQGSWKF